VAFLRVKRSGGHTYAYLVENHWVPGVAQPRQAVLAYLGRADRLRIEEIPAAYRTETVRRALARIGPAESRRSLAAVGAYRAAFLRALLAADLAAARREAHRAVRAIGRDAFYAEVLAEAMHDIGRAWADGRLSISDEHLATGVAASVVRALRGETRPRGPEVLLAVPPGEEHTLALSVAEGVLARRGYTPVNLGGAVPMKELVEYVLARRPHAVLISATNDGSAGRAVQLARAIRRASAEVPVVIGGRASAGVRPPSSDPGIEFFSGPVSDLVGSWGSPGTARSRRPGSVGVGS
jgi:methanogenic corrinoid protein MtbC1